MSASRKTVRGALATALGTGVTLAQNVYGYRIAKLAGKTPVVVITSAGNRTPPEGETFGGEGVEFFFDVHVFVLFSDGGSWTEDDAEDALDDIEKQVRETIETNDKATANWSRLQLMGRSQGPGSVTIGGVEYRHEVFTVRALVLNT